MRYVVPGLLGACLCTAIILFGAVELNHAIWVYGLAGLLALIWAGTLFFAKTALWKPSPMHWPVLGFVVYTVIHYFLSPYEYLSRLELFQVGLYGLMYFLVANNINRGRDRTLVVSILLILGTLEAMYGVYQAYTKYLYVLNVERPVGFLNRASGTYICPNHLAGLLEMILGFALARLALHRPAQSDSIETQLLSKVMVAYAVLAMLAGVLFTMSRGGWASTAIGMLVFLTWGGLQTRARWPRIGVALAALCILGFLLFNVPKVRHYLTLSTLSGSQETGLALRDTSMSGRTFLWEATWKIIKDYPVFGSGAATWQWVHAKYRHPDMQYQADYAHNDILQMTSDYGIIGFLLVAATLACFYWQAGRMSTHGINSEQRCFASGAVLAITILLVHSWFDFNLHIPANGLLFCTILGLVAGMELPEGPYAPRPMKPLFRYLLGTGLILMVAAGAYFIVPTTRAVYYTELGNRSKIYLEWEDAIEYFKTALDYDPKYIRARTKLADVYVLQADFRVGDDETKVAERMKLAQKAIRHYTRAYELNRSRADVLLKLARAYVLAEEFEKAQQTYEQAIARDPNSGPLHFHFGLFLRKRGEEARALKSFEASYKLQANDSAWLNILELREAAQTQAQ